MRKYLCVVIALFQQCRNAGLLLKKPHSGVIRFKDPWHLSAALLPVLRLEGLLNMQAWGGEASCRSYQKDQKVYILII